MIKNDDRSDLLLIRLYRVSEAAALLGYGETRTREFIKSGRLKAVAVDGGEMRVPGWAIEAFVRDLPLVSPE